MLDSDSLWTPTKTAKPKRKRHKNGWKPKEGSERRNRRCKPKARAKHPAAASDIPFLRVGKGKLKFTIHLKRKRTRKSWRKMRLFAKAVYSPMRKPSIIEVVEWNLPMYGDDGKKNADRPYGYIVVSNGETTKLCHLRMVRHKADTIRFMYITFRGVHYEVVNEGLQRHPLLKLRRILKWDECKPSAERAERARLRRERLERVIGEEAEKEVPSMHIDVPVEEYDDEYMETVISDDELAVKNGFY